MKDIKSSIMSFVIRLSGVVVCSMLLQQSTITCIGSIILGLILSISAITTGHMVCAGFLFVETIVSVAIEYYVYE